MPLVHISMPIRPTPLCEEWLRDLAVAVAVLQEAADDADDAARLIEEGCCLALELAADIESRTVRAEYEEFGALLKCRHRNWATHTEVVRDGHESR